MWLEMWMFQRFTNKFDEPLWISSRWAIQQKSEFYAILMLKCPLGNIFDDMSKILNNMMLQNIIFPFKILKRLLGTLRMQNK